MSAKSQTDSQKKTIFNAKLKVDKLIINSKVYTTSNIDTLPTSLQLKHIYTPSKGDMTAFFTRASPLSNHHDSPMKVEGQSFKSNEQYYMFKKATTFADKEKKVILVRLKD